MNAQERNLSCLLGIPVDVLSFNQAIATVDAARKRGRRCFISTPNLNFIVTAHKDLAFRDSVLASDLVLLDGMPPVWIARFIGIDGIEKISGSSLIERLWRREAPESDKLKVFLFGGEDGIAELACERINESSTGLECVGWHSPGFGSVAEMSETPVLQAINAAKPDFVIVALGARKGQEWIMANMHKLDAPLICHLGAVINFAAGNVVRAPLWMQQAGMEWIWRIFQEPALWQRYLLDGLYFGRHLLPGLLRYRLWRWSKRRKLDARGDCEVRMDCADGKTVISIEGSCLRQTLGPLRKTLALALRDHSSIVLDLGGVDLVDEAFLGLCLAIYGHAVSADGSLSIRRADSEVRRVFAWNAVEWLL